MHLTLHMPCWHTEYIKILKLRSNHWHTKCKTFFGLKDLSLLAAVFWDVMQCSPRVTSQKEAAEETMYSVVACVYEEYFM